MKRISDETHKNNTVSQNPANLREPEEAVLNKGAEEKLKESEERFRLFSDVAEEGIAIHDEGVIVEANQALAHMFGYELSEVIGMHAEKLAHPGIMESRQGTHF